MDLAAPEPFGVAHRTVGVEMLRMRRLEQLAASL
jgi:hypothetical protein